jgi:hypothetical protein
MGQDQYRLGLMTLVGAKIARREEIADRNVEPDTVLFAASLKQ